MKTRVEGRRLAALTLATLVAAQSIAGAVRVTTLTLSALALGRQALAGPLEDAAAEGQTLGADALRGFGLTNDPDHLRWTDGSGAVREEALGGYFPAGGSADDRAALEGAFGDPAALEAATTGIVERLDGETSAQGDAYRSVWASATSRSHPDLRADPVWAGSQSVLDGDDPVFASFFGGCREEPLPQTGGASGHVADYRTCERLLKPTGHCAIAHTFEVTLIEWLGGDGLVERCGPGCIDLWAGRIGNNYWKGDCTVYEQTVRIRVTNPEAIEDATLVRAKWDDYMQVLINGEPVWQGPNSNFPPETEGACELSESWDRNPGVDVTGHFTAGGDVELRLRVSVTGAGEGYAGIRIHYDPDKVVSDGPWAPEDCIDLAHGVTDGACDGSITCLSGPDETGCLEAGGVTLCEGDPAYQAMAPSPVPGLSRLCRRAEVDVTACAFNVGDLTCWTDPDGTVHCPHNEGTLTDTCAALEGDAACGFVDSQCIDGLRGPSGKCYGFTDRYDCGYQVALPGGGGGTRTVCTGAVRCMGEDCITPPREASADFGRAAAAVQTAQFTATDVQCDAETGAGCEVFRGEHTTCKKALGGWVDCCEQPTGISIVDYMQLAYSGAKLADQAGLVEALAEAGLDLPGAWNAMTEPLTTAWSEVTQPFTSAWGSAASSGSGVAAEGVETVTQEGLGQAVTNQIARLVGDAFGDAARDALFSPLEGGGGWQLGGGNAVLGTALQTVMWAYMVYAILNILVHIIWECEASEFELGAKRQLKSCAYVGSYCASRTLFGCAEKRESYCCYSSPLARIVQEQVHGGRFGSVKHPDCSGMTLDEMAALDWDAIDLTEWTALLAQAGLLPITPGEADAQYALDAATRNPFADFAAPDALERTTERIGQAQPEEAAEAVRQDLWF